MSDHPDFLWNKVWFFRFSPAKSIHLFLALGFWRGLRQHEAALISSIWTYCPL